MTPTERELELIALAEEQYIDMRHGSRQWPEHHVVASLDAWRAKEVEIDTNGNVGG